MPFLQCKKPIKWLFEGESHRLKLDKTILLNDKPTVAGLSAPSGRQKYSSIWDYDLQSAVSTWDLMIETRHRGPTHMKAMHEHLSLGPGQQPFNEMTYRMLLGSASKWWNSPARVLSCYLPKLKTSEMFSLAEINGTRSMDYIKTYPAEYIFPGVSFYDFLSEARQSRLADIICES